MLTEGDEESSSTSESEDEEGDAWTPDKEKDFFKTLSSLVSKDPSIYDSSRQFFTRDQQEITVKKKKTPKEEAVTLRDFERKMILEKEKSDHGEINTPSEMSTMTYREEQEMIKKDFKDVLQDSDSETEDLLIVRQKTSQQQVFQINVCL